MLPILNTLLNKYINQGDNFILMGELDNITKIVGKRNLLLHEPMKRHTHFKVGGRCDAMAIAKDAKHVIAIIKECKGKIPFFIMGKGSNLIVRDKGIRGVVIRMALNKIRSDGVKITSGSGVSLKRLSDFAAKRGLSGLEFASGIPGSLGGAIAMNAGAFGGEMKDIIMKTEVVDSNGNLMVIRGKQHGFGYRTSAIKKRDYIVLGAEIKLVKADRKKIIARMKWFKNQRAQKQPRLPSAGSIFKRPKRHFVGKLIEECGLKGYRIGDAEISTKHAGFIVNRGNARAEDIIRLIGHIEKEVKSRFNVKLEREVLVVGEK
jgi:UDP-N-acetylmuramate dehydrogenase